VVDFPEALWGVTFREAAGFIFDTTHAVLLAVEAKSGKDRNCLVLGSLEQVRWRTHAVPVVCSSAHASVELIGERVQFHPSTCGCQQTQLCTSIALSVWLMDTLQTLDAASSDTFL